MFPNLPNQNLDSGGGIFASADYRYYASSAWTGTAANVLSVEVATGIDLTIVGSGNDVARDASNGALTFALGESLSNTTDFATDYDGALLLVVMSQPNAVTSNSNTINIAESSDFRLQRKTSGEVQFRNATGTHITTTGAPTNGDKFLLTAHINTQTNETGDTANLWMDGVEQGTSAAANTGFSMTKFLLGTAADDATIYEVALFLKPDGATDDNFLPDTIANLNTAMMAQWGIT